MIGIKSAAFAEESAFSFKNKPLCPGTQIKWRHCRWAGTSILKSFRRGISPDVEREEHTYNESVMIATTGFKLGNFWRANIMAINSAIKIGIKSGSRKEKDQSSWGQNIPMLVFPQF